MVQLQEGCSLAAPIVQSGRILRQHPGSKARPRLKHPKRARILETATHSFLTNSGRGKSTKNNMVRLRLDTKKCYAIIMLFRKVSALFGSFAPKTDVSS